jgi:deazaflavin-dependent oxidoreductase (nitroreductase family)
MEFQSPMTDNVQDTRWGRRKFRPPPSRLIRALYMLGLGRIIGRIVLLLTTTGRKTGLARVTPLQYEEIDGAIYVASAKGTQAHWFRNILADPRVRVRIKSRRFQGLAQPVTDPIRIADFLELRLRRHPKMIGAILHSEGLSEAPTRAELEKYVEGLAMVIIRPC